MTYFVFCVLFLGKSRTSSKVLLHIQSVFKRFCWYMICTSSGHLFILVYLKLVSAIFIKFLFLRQMIVLQKLRKMLLISSKKLFSFSRYSNFCISVLSFFPPVGHCFRGWLKINLKVYDIVNCLNKNSITHFVWCLEKEKRHDIETLSIDGLSDKERFYRKITQKICSKSRSQSSL